MRVLIANAGVTAAALLLLGLAACGAPHNSDLFRSSGLGDSGGAGNASGATADPGGTSSGSSGGSPHATAGDHSGGESSAPPSGGAGAYSGGGASGASPAAGNGDCARYDADASYFSQTGHCYLVVHELATFTTAQAHCKTLGAHLVTLTSEAENDFAWSLNGEEHWIGANDGKGPNDPDKGTFGWLTGEPFTYSNWSSNQPNTSDTDCGESGLMPHCYEHCAFQWTGGEHDGQWNDRFCLHTIAAICEFEGAQ